MIGLCLTRKLQAVNNSYPHIDRQGNRELQDSLKHIHRMNLYFNKI